LIPEFYYLPEMFLNLNHNDMGIKTDKKRVDNVHLPEWCNNNPYEFIIQHRLILESQ